MFCRDAVHLPSRGRISENDAPNKTKAPLPLPHPRDLAVRTSTQMTREEGPGVLLYFTHAPENGCATERKG